MVRATLAKARLVTAQPACWQIAARRCRSSTRLFLRVKKKPFLTGTSSCRAITTPREFPPTALDQAVRIDVGGDVALTDEMQAKGIRLLTSVKSSTFYMGFNMLDPVTGSLTSRSTRLRQAISIAIDQEEFISIFANGRGIAAQGPLPPGIFGYESGGAGINRVVYDWVDGKPKRKSIEFARQLMVEAGYPNGRDEKTGEPLVVNLDTTGGGAGEKARLDWLTRQFAKIDIQLVIRSTDFNRFQDKIRKGNVQLYYLGWNADYPDLRISSSCSTGMRARWRVAGRTLRTMPVRPSIVCLPG